VQLFTGSPFWLEILGGTNDAASDILETDDGALAFGYTWNQPGTPGRSMAVRRLDHEGKVVSERAYYASFLDTIKHVERTQDGGVIALAVSYGAGAQSIPMLVKFDAGGELQWARQYGVEANPGFPPVALWWEGIAVTSDGGYVVTGTARFSNPVPASAVVARLDAAGNVRWVRSYDPFVFNLGTDGKGIAPTSDGGFVVVAEYQTDSIVHGITVKDLLAFRIDPAGELLWGTFLGSGFNDARAGQIETTPDGGSIVVGYRTLGPFGLPSEMWVVKLNGDGTIAWSSLYGDTSFNSSFQESGTRIVLTSDGGSVLAGSRTSFVNPYEPVTDVVLMRLDAAGEIVAQRRLDSIGEFTTPLGLRAAAQGFLLAGGVDADCRTCSFLPVGAARFVVAHLDDQLDCPGQCTGPNDFVRHPASDARGTVGVRLGSRTGTWVDTPLTRVDTTGPRYLCGQGSFGPPPVFESVSFNAGPQTVFCDRSQFVQAWVCSAGGVTGATPTPPVIIGVTYDSLALAAYVVDGDSTPGRNDVVSVTVNLTTANQPPDPRTAIPLLDDGSTYIQAAAVAVCSDDPVYGVCDCRQEAATVLSGDVVAGDDIYALNATLTLPPSANSDLDIGKGCIVESTRSMPFGYSPGTPLFVTLQATDHIGNVVSTTRTVTPSAATTSCSGDACACCLLFNPQPSQCSGLPGLPSPDLPDGLCRAF
jgi:hypothetical protein